MRKAREKLSRLETVLMNIVMVKLRGNGKKIFRRSYLQVGTAYIDNLMKSIKLFLFDTWLYRKDLFRGFSRYIQLRYLSSTDYLYLDFIRWLVCLALCAP